VLQRLPQALGIHLQARSEGLQRPEAVQAWLDNEYPAIEQRAIREFHWGDKQRS
jgi:hypothetical protein